MQIITIFQKTRNSPLGCGVAHVCGTCPLNIIITGRPFFFFFFSRTMYAIASDERARIRMAMDAIESKTCMRFVNKNDSSSTRALQDLGHGDHLYIARERGKGCYAMIGYHQNMGSPHTMNLEAPSCVAHQGTVQHELLHVAGLLHEQARADRDNAVMIYWENIDKSKI